MRTAAKILGIVGGVLGIVMSILVLIVGGIGSAANANWGGLVVIAGLLALGLSVLGIIGGVLVDTNPTTGALLLGIAGVGGFICIQWGFILSGPFLLVGAVLAYMSRNGNPVLASPSGSTMPVTPVAKADGTDLPR